MNQENNQQTYQKSLELHVTPQKQAQVLPEHIKMKKTHSDSELCFPDYIWTVFSLSSLQVISSW